MLYARAIKLAGLCLAAVFTVTAFVVATAQAEHTLVEIGAGSHELLTTFNPILSILDTEVIIHSTIGGTSVLIACQELAGEGGLETEGKGKGTFKYSKCKTLLNGSLSTICKPTEPIELKFKTEIFNHNGEDYTLFSPETGTTFTKIKFPNEECLLNPEQSIGGTMVFKDCQGMGMVFLVEHLMEEAGGSLFTSGAHINALKFGSNSASLLGSFWQKLGNPRMGKKYKSMLTGVL